tara:strand:- start:3457 stop:4776 length:1320 start_codon:yes stop_codon:yes gene_type:complete
MKKFFNLKTYLFLAGLIAISSFLLLIENPSKNRYQLNTKTYIKRQLRKIVTPYLLKKEITKKERQTDTQIRERTILLSNKLILNKYKLTSGFYSGISNIFPGSGYIDFHSNNIFIISSRGVLAFNSNLKNNNFIQIKNNINEFIGLKQFNKSNKYSIKDLLIKDGKIYVSFTEEIKEDCWNTSLIYADINYENIKFKKLFSPKNCIHAFNNLDNEFEPHQSGGRIISFNDNEILLSTGDYRARHLAQKKESINGKIIKINISNKLYEIISMGHRNPQGLYFDEENNFILETEHGPMGGDEINLIQVKKINPINIQNYGWAIVSAGEHYGGKNDENIEKYKKYPLYKSHIKYGFIEPLKSFVPSIGISEIVKISKNSYVVSSLKANTLYFFELNENKEIEIKNKILVNERIRDLKFKDNNLYMFMEDTASIGIINLNRNF